MENYKSIVLVLLCFLVALVTSGCSEESQTKEIYGTLEGVTVKEKFEKSLGCGSRCTERYVILEKEEQSIQLSVPSRNMYNALQKNVNLNVQYDKDYFITKLTFTELEGQ